jgi:hypothetical protein
MSVLVTATVVAMLMQGGTAVSPGAEAGLSAPTYDEVGLQWTRSPSVRDMTRFGRSTRLYGRRGTVETRCTADARGRLDCEALNESPVGFGLARAAVNIMERAQVAAVDGGSPAGRTFAFGLRFGNWPSSQIPDRFHPVEYGLRWTERPELVQTWAGMRGQGVGEIYEARFDCTALADGHLDCDLKANPSGSRTFARAAEESLEDAMVERINGDSPAGARLEWSVKVQRQTHCSGGGAINGASPPPMGDFETAEGKSLTLAAPEAPVGACVAAMVQVR